jgi:RNA polymerase sigma-70 factor (ECF subfamily)
MNSADPFEQIVSAHYEALFRFAISLTRSNADAQDLTQQTFFVWAKKGHQLHDPSKVKTWLFTTLHRTFLAARRRQIRFPHEDLQELAHLLPAVPPQSPDDLNSTDLLSALAKVDQVFRPAVALFYLQDYSYKDIAKILEVPVGTVKSRISRGIAQLRKLLFPSNPKIWELSKSRDVPPPIGSASAGPSQNMVSFQDAFCQAAGRSNHDQQVGFAEAGGN